MDVTQPVVHQTLHVNSFLSSSTYLTPKENWNIDRYECLRELMALIYIRSLRWISPPLVFLLACFKYACIVADCVQRTHLPFCSTCVRLLGDSLVSAVPAFPPASRLCPLVLQDHNALLLIDLVGLDF